MPRLLLLLAQVVLLPLAVLSLAPLARIAHPTVLSLDILSRPDHNDLRYDDVFRLVLEAFNTTFYLHLRPNDHLIHPAARVTYHAHTGEGFRTRPLLRHSVRAYLGEVVADHHSLERMRLDSARVVPDVGHPAVQGWARIVVHQDGPNMRYEGAFSSNGVVHHITTRENYVRTKHTLDPNVEDSQDSDIVIWRESDTIGSSTHTCGHDRLSFNTNPDLNPVLKPGLAVSTWSSRPLGPWSSDIFFRRDDVGGGSVMGTNFINSIGQTKGCPTDQKVIYMGVAADCAYVVKLGSQDAAKVQILTTWNSASALYKDSFNVSLGIVELQVQSPTCPNPIDSSRPWNVPCDSAQLDARLSLFSQWRGTRSSDNIGLWHLMSGCPTGSEVGIAWLATLCQTQASGSGQTVVSGAAVSTSGRTEWQVVAHEVGHNFGAIHDCIDNCTLSSPCCPLTSTTCNANSRFIMSPIAQSGENAFSQCTIGNICSSMIGLQGSPVDTSCFQSPDASRTILSLHMCGNGIVEPGEQCDPGPNVTSSCCNSTTCRLLPGALCDPSSNACCTGDCKISGKGQVCRPALDERCDRTEVCDGTSAVCPDDETLKDGTACGNSSLGLHCASGICTSPTLQCQSVGAPLSLTQACPDVDSSCQVSCVDPSNKNQCIKLTTLLTNGSPCGFGGLCSSGICKSQGALSTFVAWYKQTPGIAIPMTFILVIVALGLYVWLVRKGCKRWVCIRGEKREGTMRG